MTHTTILIPASRYVDREMQIEVGQVPPVLIPVNGKPLLDSIVEKYSGIEGECVFVLVVHEGAQQVREYLARASYRHKVKLIEVPLLSDLGQVIATSLSRPELSDTETLIINFGDTLVDAAIDFKVDTIFYADLKESYRWTTFTEQQGRITKITDRYVSEQLESNHVFTGLFVIRDCAGFVRQLEQTSGFYPALRAYLEHRDYKLAKVKEWYDFGHVDNFYQAKKRFVNKRFFNQLEIDEQRAVLTKKSRNVEKFTDEIKWYLELPSALKCFVPQVFDYSLSTKNAFVKMEYYGYPAVSDLYLYEGHSLGIWNHVFDALFGLLEEMGAYQLRIGKRKVRAALHQMYCEKTRERLSGIRTLPLFRPFFEAPTTINGVEVKPLDFYLADLETICDRLVFGSLPALSVIHGDFCISNILFDPRSRIVKVVDPRGRFGEHALYGDFRYELAKLSHSFNGNYESIITDAFFFFAEGSTVTYNFFLSDYQRSVRQMFNARLEKEFPTQVGAIQLIESLLFLSMIPLHGDKVNRQLIMLTTGIEKLHVVYESVFNKTGMLLLRGNLPDRSA